MLLNFSGSDWCGPCIRLRKEIFEDKAFEKMANMELVLVNADFPRMKKNQLAPGQQEVNNQMAEQYNPKGRFPFTVLLNADGKILTRNIRDSEFIPKHLASIGLQSCRVFFL